METSRVVAFGALVWTLQSHLVATGESPASKTLDAAETVFWSRGPNNLSPFIPNFATVDAGLRQRTLVPNSERPILQRALTVALIRMMLAQRPRVPLLPNGSSRAADSTPIITQGQGLGSLSFFATDLKPLSRKHGILVRKSANPRKIARIAYEETLAELATCPGCKRPYSPSPQRYFVTPRSDLIWQPSKTPSWPQKFVSDDSGLLDMFDGEAIERKQRSNEKLNEDSIETAAGSRAFLRWRQQPNLRYLQPAGSHSLSRHRQRVLMKRDLHASPAALTRDAASQETSGHQTAQLKRTVREANRMRSSPEDLPEVGRDDFAIARVHTSNRRAHRVLKTFDTLSGKRKSTSFRTHRSLEDAVLDADLWNESSSDLKPALRDAALQEDKEFEEVFLNHLIHLSPGNLARVVDRLWHIVNLEEHQ